MVIRVGDVVMLNSGGPQMTVESLNGFQGSVTCCWFHLSDRFVAAADDVGGPGEPVYDVVHRESFPELALKKVT